MRAEKVTAAVLGGDAGVAALVGTRIYGNVAPEESDAPAPLLIYRKLGAEREYTVHLSGAMSGATVRAAIEVLCIATSYPQLKALAEAVRLAMSGAAGTIAGVAVGYVRLTDEGADEYAPDTREHLQALTFEIAHSE